MVDEEDMINMNHNLLDSIKELTKLNNELNYLKNNIRKKEGIKQSFSLEYELKNELCEFMNVDKGSKLCILNITNFFIII